MTSSYLYQCKVCKKDRSTIIHKTWSKGICKPCQSKDKPIRPEHCENEHLEFLDELRETGVTNMFGARPYLQQEFPDLFPEEKASAIVVYWMKTFSERHPQLTPHLGKS